MSEQLDKNIFFIISVIYEVFFVVRTGFCGFQATQPRLTGCGKAGHVALDAAHLQHVQEMNMTRFPQVQHGAQTLTAFPVTDGVCVVSTALTTTITTITTTLTRGRVGTG
ncbi:hypothetical protein ACFELO_00950 [Oceanicaulis sp. LC35]|uniref:hypothetical protein n=1 Tax=Oceanicaulis sp. LC35 TaxID=3349635 RepID=UPI003F869D51